MRQGTQCVVTGLGTICANGNNTEEFWTRTVNGHSGISPVQSQELSSPLTGWAAQVKGAYSPPEIRAYSTKKMDTTSLLCLQAAEEAIEHSRLKLGTEDRQRISVVIGSCTGGPGSAERFLRRYLDKKRVSAYDVLKIPIHAVAGHIAAHFDVQGSVTNIANACAAGAISIAYACDLIRNGQADVVIAGGADAFALLQYSGFHALKALDVLPCAPFSRSGGISLGEGAGVLIIESLAHARNRGAEILGEVSGYGITSDAYHITAPKPDGEGQVAAIRTALREAGIDSGDIDYLNAHGTGTPLNDAAEQKAIEEIFSPEKLRISSTKSMIGHCLGAAGSLEAIAVLKALESQRVPPTIHYDPSHQSSFNFVPNQSQEASLDRVMSNSFAFGGNNASLIFSREIAGDTPPPMERMKVYITGIGLLSPIGNEINKYWEKMNGLKAENRLEHLKAESTSNNVKCVPNEDFTAGGVSPGFTRRLDRLSKLLLFSGVRALTDSGLSMDEQLQKDTGLIVGMSDGPADDIRNFLETVVSRGAHAGSAMLFPNTVYNAAAGHLSINQQLKGHNLTVANGVSSGVDSACDSYEIVRSGRHPVMLAAGVDEYSETIHMLYTTLKALTTDDATPQPYSFNQKGFVLGEGATTLVLESEDHALSRGASIYAEIAGYGRAYTACAPGKIDPEAGALDLAVLEACRMSGIQAEKIEAIVGFANGDTVIDTMELRSYGRLFGERLGELPIYSIKKEVGEGRAAASSLQIAHAAMLLNTGDCPNPQWGRVMTTDGAVSARKAGFSNVLVTSFSFGGSFSAMLLKKAPGQKEEG